ncbi:MAG: hypothetical protein LGR52_16155 [Candidatus Thiosymbion ectosymbiont of Robbea hypermnestra]|nr:hypothetical protein [Candidatus Thiosymbion ectosymbiont of Robbea hypermnestra]
MKSPLIFLSLVSLYGCAALVVEQPPGACPGSVKLAAERFAAFEPIEDPALLNAALGAPKEGGLCQGQVYKVKENARVTLYRVWNSTNPESRLGKWWALDRPEGKVTEYRTDYDICYQWSPLDKLTHCEFTAGTKVVIGTGQSAECSQYLTYPSSSVQQVYLEQATESVANCRDYDALFRWESPVK